MCVSALWEMTEDVSEFLCHTLPSSVNFGIFYLLVWTVLLEQRYFNAALDANGNFRRCWYVVYILWNLQALWGPCAQVYLWLSLTDLQETRANLVLPRWCVCLSDTLSCLHIPTHPWPNHLTKQSYACHRRCRSSYKTGKGWKHLRESGSGNSALRAVEVMSIDLKLSGYAVMKMVTVIGRRSGS